jgi:hypothetical protein
MNTSKSEQQRIDTLLQKFLSKQVNISELTRFESLVVEDLESKGLLRINNENGDITYDRRDSSEQQRVD